MSLSSGDTD